MSDIDDIREAVEGAQDKSVFNLVNVIKGRGYPEDQVTVFTDVEAAYSLADLEESMKTIAASPEQAEYREEYNKLEEVAEELREEIRKSALTFHLRGISPGHIKKIMRAVHKQSKAEDMDQSEFDDLLEASYVAPHIIKVVDAEGNTEERVYTPQDVLDLIEYLDNQQYAKLSMAVGKLSFVAAQFDVTTDAGFLPKS